MKTLHLVLTGHWYDEIKKGKKRIEYRQMKAYWIKRILKDKEAFTHVIFHRGYTDITQIFKVTKININSMTDQIEIHFEEEK
jgi:hypothetical protein